LIDYNNGGESLIDLKKYLNEFPTLELQKLHFALRDVFTQKCNNDNRLRIIKSLYSIPQDQWMVLLKQICFITPIGSRGEDVMGVAEVLSSRYSTIYRERLVNTANRFFKYDTTILERYYILAYLTKRDPDELIAIDKYDEKEKEGVIKEALPSYIDIREFGKIASFYDRISDQSFDFKV
jgi:hypothetical protein